MRVNETSVYQFDELSDKAKERAREWYRDASQGDEWWDCTYDSIQDAAKYEECLVRFMQWMYRQLEAEYDYRNSDEQIDKSITANEYEFTEDGKRF